MALAVNPAYGPARGLGLGSPGPDERNLVSRIESRRLALQGDNAALRLRYDEIMRWVNPPWDDASKRIDPRPEAATAARQGEPILHVDHVSQVLTRWTALQAGKPFVFRVKPKTVQTPLETGDQDQLMRARAQYDIDRAARQNQATQMEIATQDWLDRNDFARTLMWACWSKEAFGKAVIRSGWDPIDGYPTAELIENPSQVYYAWTSRYGRRELAWAMLAEQMDPAEANVRFGLDMPTDAYGNIDLGSWMGGLDTSDMDTRTEQTQALSQMVWCQEYYELRRTAISRNSNGEPIAWRREIERAFVIGGRVVEYAVYPFSRVPIHVIENEHIPTWLHGKSTAEAAIIINAAYDDMLDRQAAVIDFEAGPRYKGLNMGSGGDEVDIPDPFNLIPLREGEDIQQIDTHIDFFPTQLHANELREALYKVTGLTPIAWGMSPNAQTSGRAMAAEWRAVELPLAVRLVTMTPEVKGLLECWWDYAEAYDPDSRLISHGGRPGDTYYTGRYRRFEVLWEPLDIRDKNEQTIDILARLNASAIDLSTALEEWGYSNPDEIIARIKSWMLDPVLNPLRYQQYLTLQQLQLTIRAQAAQVAAMEQQAAQAEAGAPSAPPGGAPAPGELQAQGANAAAQQAQGELPVSEAQNQPGEQPGGGGLPVATRVLAQNPSVGGVQNRAMVQMGAPPTAPPSNGQAPR
jgi:hypothetical protein